MSRSFVNWLKHAALAFLVAMPLVALGGFVFRWPAGEQALSRYSGQTPIMISFFFHSKTWRDARRGVWVTRTDETRSYILFPSVFGNPRIITVSQKDDHAPTVSESNAPLTLIGLAGAAAFSFFGVWYFWIRPARQYRLSPQDAATFYASRSPQAGFGRRIGSP